MGVRLSILALAASLLTIASSPDVRAQDAEAVRLRNAVNDQTRAYERKVEIMRRLETLQRDHVRRTDSARQNAERDSRSMRRFDR